MATPSDAAVKPVSLCTRSRVLMDRYAKDKRQGVVLLDACRFFLRDTYLMDIDFVLDLPSELRDLFNEWAASSGHDPMSPDDGDSGSAEEAQGKLSHRFRR